MSSTEKGKSAVMDILLVEDNPGDVRLTREALRECRAASCLHTARDGVEALAFLRKEGTHAGAPVPHLILLDLNLPRKDGHEVLRELKADPLLRHIPVIVLTTSVADVDIARAYDAHANCYVSKPATLEEFERLVQLIDDFWCNSVIYSGGRRTAP